MNRPYASILVALAGLTAGLGTPPPTVAQAPAVPRFSIEPSPLQIAGAARPGRYIGAAGRASAILGDEDGRFEAWSWPVKLLHDFRLSFKIPEYTDPIPGSAVARRTIVRPELTTVVYSHATFTVKEHLLVPLHEPGAIVLLEASSVTPLEIIASFQADLDLMWPAGLGGQYAFWDAGNHRFLLSESRQTYNALVGSPWATEGSSHPAHAAPDAPSVFHIPVDTARARQEFIPIVLVGGALSRDSAEALYARLLAGATAYYRKRREHADSLREEMTSIRTPDPTLDGALEWAKVNLDDALVCNPDLGCGLVAGYGHSGRGRRPGFAWFFGGDASINTLGILPYGGFDLARAALEFQRRYQRADGKMPHEVSQAAMRTPEPWFTAYPYPYYHADTTPYWVAALYEYWLQTADTAYVRASWPAIQKAYEWGLANDSDGDGIVDNTSAGLGAVEVGALGQDLHQDIYLAAVWLESLRATSDLAGAVGDVRLAREAAGNFERAWSSLEREYFIPDSSLYAFGILKGGRTNPAVTVWPATAMAFSLLDNHRVTRTLDALASHRLSTEWGSRMLDAENPLYDPLGYNMGAVWPFVTGFVGWAAYNYHRPFTGFAALWANARSTFDEARGRNPELMSGAFHRTLDATVPDQFFATSMIPTPLFRGLLGLSADAPRHSLRFMPHLPVDWDSVSVLRYPIGGATLDIQIRRETVEGGTDTSAANSRLTARFTRHGAGPTLDVQFAPGLPPGSEIIGAEIDGRPAEFTSKLDVDDVHAVMRVKVAEGATVRLDYRSGVGLVPPRPEPAVGASASALRILRYRYDEPSAEYRLQVEGRGGRAYELELVSPVGPPVELSGAQLEPAPGDRYRLHLRLEGPPDRFVPATVRFRKPRSAPRG